jgi:hypothetical protein
MKAVLIEAFSRKARLGVCLAQHPAARRLRIEPMGLRKVINGVDRRPASGRCKIRSAAL